MPETDTISLIEQLNVLKSSLSQCQMQADEHGHAQQAESLAKTLKHLQKLIKKLIGHAYQDLIAATHPLIAEVRVAQSQAVKAIETVNNQIQFVKSVVELVGQVDQVVAQVKQYCHL